MESCGSYLACDYTDLFLARKSGGHMESYLKIAQNLRMEETPIIGAK